MNQRSDDPRRGSDQDDRPLDARDERALDDLVARLRAPRRNGDALSGFVDAARQLDRADARAVEANLDAVYEEYAATSGRVGTLDFLATRLRHSPLLRLVAASIAVHALALPVLAVVALLPDPEPPYTLEFELPADRPPVEDAPDEGLEALDAATLLDESTEGGEEADGSDADATLDGVPAIEEVRDEER